MDSSITIKGYTYTAGLTRQDLYNSKIKESYCRYCGCFHKTTANFDKELANFDKIDINQDLVLSEEEITKFKKKRITKGVLIGLGVVATATLIGLGISKGCNVNLNQKLKSSSKTSTSSRTRHVMSRAEFVDHWHRNNNTLHGTCPRDFSEYISDLYDDYLSGRL